MESSTLVKTNVWQRLTSNVLLALLFLHCYAFVLRQQRYQNVLLVELNRIQPFFYFPKICKHHLFKDGSPEKDTQLRKSARKWQTMEERMVHSSQGSVKWVSMCKKTTDIPKKECNQKECWHDMKFILWQDGMKQNKICFEIKHFIQSVIFGRIELLFRLLVK